MRIAVLIKQVPRFEAMALGSDGRLVREGLELEMNPYCRRAVSKGVELARLVGGRCSVFTLGPLAAEDSLREAVAWGADEGFLISDQAFAGSDTLATARALAAALEREGPFDLVLAGRNSVDADTGQVAPELAELMDLPILTGVRELHLRDRSIKAHLEYDDGWAEAEVDLPAVLTCAERLCEPAKVAPEERVAVPAELIRRLSATDLGLGPWGQAGSPTSVGDVRLLQVERDRRILSGPIEDQVAEAVHALADAGALSEVVAEEQSETVASEWDRGPSLVAVLIEGDRARVARELLGAAANLASKIGGGVVAVAQEGVLEPALAATWGADELVLLSGDGVAEDVAAVVTRWCSQVSPWAVLAPSTMWGREVASRVAARLGAGLTGDAVDLAVDGGRLVASKPAFGGQLVAAVTASSPVQMATVRPGVLPAATPRRSGKPPPLREMIALVARDRLRLVASGRDDDVDDLEVAGSVVGVGTGVNPDEYELLRPLLKVLGAELAATRKVTDRGWQPRSRQIGITGRSLAPRLYVAVGVAGKFNHMVGVRGAGKILAINHDRDALVFGTADVGIVADWHEAVPVLTEAVAAYSARV